MNSKLDLRLEAARLATMVDDITPKRIVPTAKEIEAYVLGDAELPETYDANELLTKSMAILNKGGLGYEVKAEKGTKIAAIGDK